MEKSSKTKKYIDISGFNIRQSNRGNAALSYGSLGFLQEKGLIEEEDELIYFQPFLNIFRKCNLIIRKESYCINDRTWKRTIVPVFYLEKLLVMKYGLVIPFTAFGRYIKHVKYEAADYGGDGFSDIYGEKDFLSRMNQTFLLWKNHIPLIMLPQTLGPFEKEENFQVALKVMRYAKEIYVRDAKFADLLKKYNISFTQTKDLSSYMVSEPWDIVIRDNSIGLNVSGLAYFNNFHGLEGQFDAYPELVNSIIKHYRDKGYTVYLIPHSYTYNVPDDNDDMEACREAYNNLSDKFNVVLVDKDMTAPQVKYVISKMKYFIGTRMHANFAAIYTGVPVFGIAYSYKFQGAFDANGLDGKNQTEMINNLKYEDIDKYIAKIDKAFNIYDKI